MKKAYRIVSVEIYTRECTKQIRPPILTGKRDRLKNQKPQRRIKLLLYGDAATLYNWTLDRKHRDKIMLAFRYFEVLKYPYL